MTYANVCRTTMAHCDNPWVETCCNQGEICFRLVQLWVLLRFIVLAYLLRK